jgi:hypothetical protein
MNVHFWSTLFILKKKKKRSAYKITLLCARPNEFCTPEIIFMILGMDINYAWHHTNRKHKKSLISNTNTAASQTVEAMALTLLEHLNQSSLKMAYVLWHAYPLLGNVRETNN